MHFQERILPYIGPGFIVFELVVCEYVEIFFL